MGWPQAFFGASIMVCLAVIGVVFIRTLGDRLK